MKKLTSLILSFIILLIAFSAFTFSVSADDANLNYGYLGSYYDKYGELVYLQIFDEYGVETTYGYYEGNNILLNGINTYSAATVLNTLSTATGSYCSFELSGTMLTKLNTNLPLPANRQVNVTLNSIDYNMDTSIAAKMRFNCIKDDCLVLLGIYDYSNTRLLDAVWKTAKATDTEFTIGFPPSPDNVDYLDLPAKVFFWDKNDFRPLNVVLDGTVNVITTIQFAHTKGINAVPSPSGIGYDVSIQILSTDGIETYSINNTHIWLADRSSFNVNASEWTSETAMAKMQQIGNSISGPVVRLYKNTLGNITHIFNADYNSDFEETTPATLDSVYKYDSANRKFINYGWFDEDTMVFFIDNDMSLCRVGTLADLKDGYSYSIMASYASGSTINNSILAVSASVEIPEEIEPLPAEPTSVAIITEISNGSDGDGNTIWTVDCIIDSEELHAVTTPAVAQNTMPTKGDVVKIGLNENNEISLMEYVWDFPEGVRNFTTNEPVSFSAGNNAYTPDNEVFAGGIVTSYNDKSSEAIIDGNVYRLLKAKNIYVIDAVSQRTMQIKNSDLGAFTYFEALYATSGTTTITDVAGLITGTADASMTFDMSTESLSAQKFADHIYVRTYNGIPKDVIIVKGATIRVTSK